MSFSYVLKASRIISFYSHLKIQIAPFFKMATSLHKQLVLVIEEKSVGRFEWYWCHFACFKGCLSNIWRSCSPLTCHFLKMLLQALRFAIDFKLCCTSSLVFCLRVNGTGPGHCVPPSVCLPFWYCMEPSCRSDSKKFLSIYSRICLVYQQQFGRFKLK